VIVVIGADKEDLEKLAEALTEKIDYGREVAGVEWRRTLELCRTVLFLILVI
jgi:hypothetical protein